MLILEVFFADDRATKIPSFRTVGALEEVHPDIFVNRVAPRSSDTGIRRNRYVCPQRLIVSRGGWFDGEIASGSSLVHHELPGGEHVSEVICACEPWGL